MAKVCCNKCWDQRGDGSPDCWNLKCPCHRNTCCPRCNGMEINKDGATNRCGNESCTCHEESSGDENKDRLLRKFQDYYGEYIWHEQMRPYFEAFYDAGVMKGTAEVIENMQEHLKLLK